MQLVGRLSGAGRVFGRLSALRSFGAPLGRLVALVSRVGGLLPSGGRGAETSAESPAPSTGSLYDALTQRISLPILALAIPVVMFALGVMAVTADGIAGQVSGYYQAAAMPGVLISFMLASFAGSRRLQAQAMEALAPLSAIPEAELPALRERALRPPRSIEMVGMLGGFAAWAFFERAWQVNMAFPLTQGWVLASHALVYTAAGWFILSTAASAQGMWALWRGGISLDLYRREPVDALARWALASAGTLAGAALIGALLTPPAALEQGSARVLIVAALIGAIAVFGAVLWPAYRRLGPVRTERRRLAMGKVAEYSERMEASANPEAGADSAPPFAAAYASWVTYERVVRGLSPWPGGTASLTALGVMVALPALVLALRLNG